MLEWLEMTFGSLLIAVGVYFFKVPNGFSLGGVSGISTLLGKVITWSWVTPGMLMFGLNVILLIIGFIVIGKDTGIRTAYCSLAYSGMTWILERTVKLEQPMTDQPFLELVYAILLTGIGSAIMFHCRASSGGTDIVALILKKYTSLDVGKALLCSDSLISARVPDSSERFESESAVTIISLSPRVFFSPSIQITFSFVISEIRAR